MLNVTYDWVIEFFKQHPATGKFLDVGGRDVMGGNLEGIISKTEMEYVSADMLPGTNVDVVVNGHELDTVFAPESFDVVCCFDTFEHDDKFWLTLEQMKKVLKKGGWMLIGVPGGNCPLHEHPNDYWRFMEPGVKSMFEGFENTDFKTYWGERDIANEMYGWGQKPI